MLDLAVRQGTVVTADTTIQADIGVEDGVIVEVGVVGAARRDVDATGLQVLPGGVDPHTHLDNQREPGGPRSADDYFSGTVAAACGGVTTVVDFARQYPGWSLGDTLDYWGAKARTEAVIDYSFHLMVQECTPGVLDEVAGIAEAGFPSFKIFTNRLDDDSTLRMLRAAAAEGGLTVVHCENGAIDRDALARLAVERRTSVRDWADARPTASEVEATGRAIDYCAYTAAPIYIVHVSCAEAVERIRAARDRGLPVWAETRPCYLLLTRDAYQAEAPRHLMVTGNPPLRESSDVQALWTALGEGAIDTIGSDHSTWTVEQKAMGAQDVTQLIAGLPSLETQMPALYSEGVSSGRISVNRLVAVTATDPARLFGLYPRKGTIAVGSDADMVLFDPRRREPIRYERLHGRCGYEPLEGLECTGWPVLTIAGGRVVARDGQFLGERGSGRLLRRERFVVSTPAPA